MATVQQVEDAIRAAAAKGDKALVLKLAEARKTLLAQGQGGPTAEAGDALREQQIKQTVGDYKKDTPWSRVGTTIGDLATMAEQGLTFGFADEINALVRSVSPDVTYEDAIAPQRRMIQDAKARMNDTAPYSAEVFEGLTSMGLPTGAAKVLPEAGALTKGLIYGTEGALQSGVSSLGHGNSYKDAVIDSILGGATGGVGGLVANPIARWAGGGKKEFANAGELFEAGRAKPGNKGLKRRVQGMEDVLIAEGGTRKDFGVLADRQAKQRELVRAKGPRAAGKMNRNPLEEQILTKKIANAPTPPAKKWLGAAGSGMRGGGGWGALYANILNVPGAALESISRNMSDMPKAEIRKLKNQYLGGTPDDEAAMNAARDALSRIFTGAGRAQPAVLDGEPQNVFGKNYTLRP